MKKFIAFLPWLGALILVAVALLSFESDLLWKVQQYNLFLDTPLYFREQMLVPGGFLSYISCYFTQFFFHPWLGVLILCLWWLLLMWGVKRAFRISDSWAVVSLVPVTLLLIANMDLGYWHYFMKLRGYFFVPTIGTTFAVAMLWGFRALPQRRWLRMAWLLPVAVIGYPLLGFYALAALLLMGIWDWRLSKSHAQSGVLSGIVLILLIAVPLFYYRFVYYQTNMGDLWTTALPTFTAINSYPVYYTPYYLLGGSFLLMVLLYQTGISARLQKKYVRWGAQLALVVVLAGGVWHYWYKDDIFHHELAMQRAIENTDWDGVLLESQKLEGEPTRGIVLMRNIALSRLGRQLDEMYNFPKGGKKSNTSIPVSMVYHVFGRLIYYNYGLLNDCHRICLEDGVEYGWRVELLEYMARCSLLSGETKAAQKVLNLLRHTQYHGKWADAMQELIDHPEQIAEARETGPVSHLQHYQNALGSDGGEVEKYVMGQLAFQDSDDPYFQEQALLATLWLRDQHKFWKRFVQYVRLHPHAPMPRIFQEAAYLFGRMEKRPDLEKLPFDKSVINTYNTFMKEAAKYDNQSAEYGRIALSPFFGNTYFYEYYFLKNTH